MRGRLSGGYTSKRKDSGWREYDLQEQRGERQRYSALSNVPARPRV